MIFFITGSWGLYRNCSRTYKMCIRDRTDATQVVCDPPRVIARFQESFEESVRDYLHLVLHLSLIHI